MIIAVLEDDESRQQMMRCLLAEACAAYQAVFFDNAPDMISWLSAHLPEVALICLDHDLGPNRERAGQVFDPGTGRDVVNVLTTCAPSCPVIIHTANYLAAPGMMLALEPLGWDVKRAIPANDLAWLTREWVHIVRDLLSRTA